MTADKKKSSGGKPKPALYVNDVIGKALSRIGTFKELDTKQQKVALINPVMIMKPSSHIPSNVIYYFASFPGPMRKLW